jgi:hypothetical protein
VFDTGISNTGTLSINALVIGSLDIDSSLAENVACGKRYDLFFGRLEISTGVRKSYRSIILWGLLLLTVSEPKHTESGVWAGVVELYIPG